MSPRNPIRRRGFGNITSRTTSTGEVHYRPRYSCPICQAASDVSWEQGASQARAAGLPEPNRKRIMHAGPWGPSHDSAAAWLREIESEQRVYDDDWARGPERRAFAQHQCAFLAQRQVPDAAGSTEADLALWGPPLSRFAAMVLERTTGAESTRHDDRKLWEEKVYGQDGAALGLGERFGHRPVRTISKQDVREWMRETERRPGKRAGSTLSASQVRQRFYLLRRILRAAIDEDALETDPTSQLRPPAAEQGRAVTGTYRGRDDERFLPTVEQMRTLIAAMPPAEAAACALAFGAGMRAGEVTALERRDAIRHGEARWEVSITKSESQAAQRFTSSTKTGRGGQGVRALPIWAGEALEAHLAALGRDLEPGERLFPSKVKAVSLSHTAIRKALKKASEATGLPRPTLQDLRAAGEKHVAGRLGRAAAAEWARHGLQVQMAHYVGGEAEKVSAAAAGWDDGE